jgi:Glycine rich protein
VMRRSFSISGTVVGLLCSLSLLAGCGGRGNAVLETPSIPGGAVNRSPEAGVPPPLLCIAPSPAPTTTPPNDAQIQTFSYTGAETRWFVPEGVTSVTVRVQGAQGTAAPGGCVSGTISVTPGESLYVRAGGVGQSDSTGGFNGGGNGGSACCGGSPGGGGGGATSLALVDRRVAIIAGGGGGSSGGGWTGGGGGGATGGGGLSCCGDTDATGGSQMSGGKPGSDYAGGGSAGTGGSGASRDSAPQSTFGGGGGGGGYFGGGGGSASIHETDGRDIKDGGGGGGSSYYDPVTVSHVVTVQGVHFGSGAVTVSWLPTSKTIVTSLNDPTNIAEDIDGDFYVANANPYVSVYKPDGSLLYKIGSGFKNITGLEVDALQPSDVYVLAGNTVYLVKPPFNNGGTVVNTGISLTCCTAHIAVDEKYLYFATTTGPPYGGGHDVEFHSLDPQTHLPAKNSSYTVHLSGVITSVAAEQSKFDMPSTVFATLAFPPGRLSKVVRIAATPPNVTVTEVENGAPFVSLIASAADAGGGAYVIDSFDPAVLKIPSVGRFSYAGTSWDQPVGVAVKPGCQTRCFVNVLDDNQGGEIVQMEGLGQ